MRYFEFFWPYQNLSLGTKFDKYRLHFEFAQKFLTGLWLVISENLTMSSKPFSTLNQQPSTYLLLTMSSQPLSALIASAAILISLSQPSQS
jgi:hypothetical protein